MRAKISVFVTLLLASFVSTMVSAQTVTIDFEDAPPEMAVSPGFIGTYEEDGYNLVSSYCCWGTISQPPVLTSKAVLFGAWGFDFNLYGDDFSLLSFDVGFLQGEAGVVRIRGYRDGSQVNYQIIPVPAADRLPFFQTIDPGPGWDNLDRVNFDMSAASCCPGDASAMDNIVLSTVPRVVAPVDISVTPLAPDGLVHPHHNGGAAAVAGLNDVIEVVVHGSSTLVGDSTDFAAADIDPATLKFGPAEGGIAAGTSPTFNVDYDSDGIDDAKFSFLTGDSGLQCSDTDAELTGVTTGGQDFSGIDSVNPDCDALCHN